MRMYDFPSWVLPGSSRRSSSPSASPTAGGSPSVPPKRMSAGTVSAQRASSEGAPTTRSISATSRSSGPMWRGANRSRGRSTAMEGLLRLLAQERLIRLGGEQGLHLRGIAERHLDHPALVVGILVDVLGRVGERRVHLEDGAGERREEIGHGL